MIIVFSLEEKMNKINKTLEGCLAHTKKMSAIIFW